MNREERRSERGGRRPVRSYVLRQGRITSGQQRALARWWKEYGIEPASGVLDPVQRFGRSAPLTLDIGTGMGDTTCYLAQCNPQRDYLAVEVHRPGVGSLLRRARELGIGNLRVLCQDVMEVLQQQVPERCLDEVLVLFPDPWPKKRHHKRRLVSRRFLDLLLGRMQPQARLYLATDDAGLARHMLETVDAHPGFTNMAGPGNFAPRPCWRPRTRFEQRGIARGAQIRDLAYCLAPPSRSAN